MKLYELSADFQQLFDMFEEIEQSIELLDRDNKGNYLDADGNVIPDIEKYKEDMREAWYDTLEGIETEFEQKAESVACVIKKLEAEAKIMKAEEKALAARRKSKENQQEFLENYLLTHMAATNRDKIDMPRAIISIRNNAESLVVDDEQKLIEWLKENNDDLLKYSEPEPKGSEIKKLYKIGVQIPFVHLVRKKSLRIK